MSKKYFYVIFILLISCTLPDDTSVQDTTTTTESQDTTTTTESQDTTTTTESQDCLLYTSPSPRDS